MELVDEIGKLFALMKEEAEQAVIEKSKAAVEAAAAVSPPACNACSLAHPVSGRVDGLNLMGCRRLRARVDFILQEERDRKLVLKRQETQNAESQRKQAAVQRAVEDKQAKALHVDSLGRLQSRAAELDAVDAKLREQLESGYARIILVFSIYVLQARF